MDVPQSVMEGKGESEYREKSSDLKEGLRSHDVNSNESESQSETESVGTAATSTAAPTHPETAESRPMVKYMTQKIVAAGLRIFYAMEFVGEIVCNIIGLNESKYQYVLDSMDENDWKIAKENEEKRTSEAQLRAIPV